MPITVPEAFANATAEREGQRGRDWIDTLPGIVAGLLDRWNCKVEGAVTHGGVALIVPVFSADHGPAVLKVSFTHPGNIHEPYALTAWNGDGAVQLLERHDEVYAMLLERLTSMSLASLPDPEEAMRVAGELSLRLAVDAPAECPDLAAQLADWRTDIVQGSAELPTLLEPVVVSTAMGTLDFLAAEKNRTLIHGDLHAGNILASDTAGWQLTRRATRALGPSTRAWSSTGSPSGS